MYNNVYMWVDVHIIIIHNSIHWSSFHRESSIP